MRRLLITFACFGFFYGAPAHAFVDGNELYSDCIAENPVRRLACSAFIMGVWGGYRLAVPEERMAFTIPGAVIRQQLVDVVSNFLRENPDKRHLFGEMLVIMALAKSFPRPPQG